MNWGTHAAILLAADAYDGHWLTLGRIARRLQMAPETLQPICEALVREHQLAGAVVDGQACFGVHCTAASEVIA